MKKRAGVSGFCARAGITLTETLVALALVGLLAAVLTPAMSGIRARSLEVQCAGKLRALGSAIHLYALEHDGRFPRSFHSAGANREPGWARSVAPYLTGSADWESGDWSDTFNAYYRSPFHEETNASAYSYGLNVYFELNPESESYEGSPQTWRRPADVPRPSQTIMLARIAPTLFGDHFMCHFWGGVTAARNAIRTDAHDGRAHILYVDGHVGRRAPEETFNPGVGVNHWNPSRAGGG